MADIFVAAGGSGGASSDEATARAADVLSGKTYLGADTSDDVGAGAMPDNGAMQKTLRAGESVTVPRGYHNGSGSVTAAPLAEQTPGNAAPGDIVAGTSAWVRGAKMDGTLVEREGEQPATGVTISDGAAHVGMPPGAYRKNGRYGTPEVKAPVDMVARAAGLDGTKMLQGYAPLGVPGQVKVFNTMGPSGIDPRGSLTTEYGIDLNAHTLWMHAPAHNAYYMREDGHPHICMDSGALGDATAQQVLQGCTFTSKNGMKIPGAIYRWPLSGDIGGQRVMDAYERTAFIGEYGAQGVGVFMRMPGGSQIDPTCMWAFAPMPGAIASNIREGVNIGGRWGTMKDYAASCVPFDGAHFDGTHISGWASGAFRYPTTQIWKPLQVGDFGDTGISSQRPSSYNLTWAFTPTVHLGAFRRVRITAFIDIRNCKFVYQGGSRGYAAMSVNFMRIVGGNQGARIVQGAGAATGGFQQHDAGVYQFDIPVETFNEPVVIMVNADISQVQRISQKDALVRAGVSSVELIA